jgi:hypothetical protein
MKNLSKKRNMVSLAVLLAIILAGCNNFVGDDSLPIARAVNSTWNITSEYDLSQIGTPPYLMSDDYVLTASFSLDHWVPIGTIAGAAFTGTFDGDENTITINSFDPNYRGDSLGIFGYITGQGTESGDPITVQDLTVIFNTGSDPVNVRTATYIGGLAGSVQNAKLTNITIYGIANFSGAGGISLGGLVGNIQSSTISGSNSTDTRITATSSEGPVYVAGLVAYGDGVSISSSNASSTVTGNGQGHNTSAGGVAGYLTNASHVQNSSTIGGINLTAIPTPPISASNLYMIYAGGVVGYQGNGSVTEDSHSYGSVTATSPYPYAGGVVGYNYGNLDGKTGSRISRSYSAVSVGATATNDGLPYAGGVAGYNSGDQATIQDSYSTGIVSANTEGSYAWAGGVAGSNANNALIDRCYATGRVQVEISGGGLPFPQPGTDPGALAGGIVGYNYFTSTTTVSNSVALNSLIFGRDISGATLSLVDLHRVAGRNGQQSTPAALINNYANVSMNLSPWPTSFYPTTNGTDGADIVSVPDEDFYADDLGWNFTTIWQLRSSDIYPTLQ